MSGSDPAGEREEGEVSQSPQPALGGEGFGDRGGRGRGGYGGPYRGGPRGGFRGGWRGGPPQFGQGRAGFNDQEPGRMNRSPPRGPHPALHDGNERGFPPEPGRGRPRSPPPPTDRPFHQPAPPFARQGGPPGQYRSPSPGYQRPPPSHTFPTRGRPRSPPRAGGPPFSRGGGPMPPRGYPMPSSEANQDPEGIREPRYRPRSPPPPNRGGQSSSVSRPGGPNANANLGRAPPSERDNIGGSSSGTSSSRGNIDSTSNVPPSPTPRDRNLPPSEKFVDSRGPPRPRPQEAGPERTDDSGGRQWEGPGQRSSGVNDERNNPRPRPRSPERPGPSYSRNWMENSSRPGALDRAGGDRNPVYRGGADRSVDDDRGRFSGDGPRLPLPRPPMDEGDEWRAQGRLPPRQAPMNRRYDGPGQDDGASQYRAFPQARPPFPDSREPGYPQRRRPPFPDDAIVQRVDEFNRGPRDTRRHLEDGPPRGDFNRGPGGDVGGNVPPQRRPVNDEGSMPPRDDVSRTGGEGSVRRRYENEQAARPEEFRREGGGDPPRRRPYDDDPGRQEVFRTEDREGVDLPPRRRGPEEFQPREDFNRGKEEFGRRRNDADQPPPPPSHEFGQRGGRDMPPRPFPPERGNFGAYSDKPVYAREQRFEVRALDRPSDRALDRPSDRALDRPSDRALDRPSEGSQQWRDDRDRNDRPPHARREPEEGFRPVDRRPIREEVGEQHSRPFGRGLDDDIRASGGENRPAPPRRYDGRFEDERQVGDGPPPPRGRSNYFMDNAPGRPYQPQNAGPDHPPEQRRFSREPGPPGEIAKASSFSRRDEHFPDYPRTGDWPRDSRGIPQHESRYRQGLPPSSNQERGPPLPRDRSRGRRPVPQDGPSEFPPRDVQHPPVADEDESRVKRARMDQPDEQKAPESQSTRVRSQSPGMQHSRMRSPPPPHGASFPRGPRPPYRGGYGDYDQFNRFGRGRGYFPGPPRGIGFGPRPFTQSQAFPGPRGHVTGPSETRAATSGKEDVADNPKPEAVKREPPVLVETRLGSGEVEFAIATDAMEFDMDTVDLTSLHESLLNTLEREELRQAERHRQELEGLRQAQFISRLAQVPSSMQHAWSMFELREAEEKLIRVQASRRSITAMF